jgi:hypothetical protein
MLLESYIVPSAEGKYKNVTSGSLHFQFLLPSYTMKLFATYGSSTTFSAAQYRKWVRVPAVTEIFLFSAASISPLGPPHNSLFYNYREVTCLGEGDSGVRLTTHISLRAKLKIGGLNSLFCIND